MCTAYIEDNPNKYRHDCDMLWRECGNALYKCMAVEYGPGG
jgi:hypothetical protein